MSEWGFTDAGFVRKRLEDILIDLNAGMVGIYGENWNPDPDQSNGQMLGLYAGSLDEVWGIVEEITNQFSPQGSRGVQLSSLVQLNGILRKDEAFTTVLATLTGTAATILQAGALASTTAGDVFSLVNDIEFDGSGDFVGAQFVAIVAGPVPAAAATLTTITTPVSNWLTVTNPAGGTLGMLVESDPDLHRRRQVSTELGATNTQNALLASLAALDGVTDVTQIVNDTNVDDVTLTPTLEGKQFRCIVEGGVDLEIAETIWEKHPFGIDTSGTTTVVVVDDQDVNQNVSFNRPAGIDIHVEMTIVTNAAFPAGGDALIKQAIVDYAAGQLTGYDGAEDAPREAFDIADDVIWSDLFKAINSIPGHSVTTMFIGLATSPTLTANLAIDDDEKSAWDTARIVVNV